jgi:hypothetical protein
MRRGNIVDTLGLIGIVFALVLLAAMPAAGQILGGRPGARLGARLGERLRAPADEVVAVAGSPFGVGRITVQMPPDRSGSILAEPPLTLTEANGRVFYPATIDTPIRAAIRELLVRPRPATVYFLFTGEEPLDLTLFGPSGVAQRAAIQRDPQLHRQLLAEWWKQYTTAIRRPNRSDNYPHLVDAYLTSMLANRLSLQPVEWPRGLLAEKLPEMGQTLGLMLGTESARLAIERDTMLSTSAGTLADVRMLPLPQLQPLPQPVPLAAAAMPELLGDVQIEPLAMHVPEECLYVRFAGFSNYDWFRSTLDAWGGDLRNLISLRGVDYGLNSRLERQLALKETALSKLMGPTVIADMAIIGDDPFLREGAAIGMLFQARANVLLANDIRQNRAQSLAANPDATEQRVIIAGHEVALLSTPDNRVRSFYAVDGDFHLVTTSRRIVERFYEAGAGKRPLGQTDDFRHARGSRKPSEADSVFAYLSEAFFRQLASPHYQIEMMRRLRSVTDIELVQMARLAARAEHKPADSIEQLISGGFLPSGFESPAHRPDGSRLVMQADGSAGLAGAGGVTDSLRGGYGTFMPVSDVDLRSATAAEIAAYEKFAQSLANGGVGPIGPASVAVQRTTQAEPGRERVTLDVRMMPLAVNADRFIRPALGPAGRQRIAPLPDDIVALEISSSGNGLLKALFPSGAGGQPNHLFAGIRNAELTNGAVQESPVADLPLQGPMLQGSVLQGVLGQLLPGLGAIEALRWYVGGWPAPGALQGLGIGGPGVQLDAEGYGFGGGFWQRQIATPAGPITVASLKRDVVAEIAGGLNIIETQLPAQLWLHVGDISNSKIAGLANKFGYLRARGVARGNANFLHSLTTQLGVPPDQALDEARRLLDARLVSPIGGRYELQSRAGEFPTWAATAQAEGPRSGLLPTPPAGFQSPPLDWLRGVDLYGGTDTTGLWAHAEILIQRPDANATNSGESIAAPRTKPQAEGPAQTAAPKPPIPSRPIPSRPIPSPPEPGPK